MVADVNQRAFSTTRGGSQETLTMSTVVARAEKVQVQYVGYFREPVFPVLEQPGRLCQSLLRYFSVYGADIRSLRINLGVLAEAHVECFLSSVRVRVWLDRLEVFLPAVQDLKQISGYLNSGWSTMADTDSSLVTTKHESNTHDLGATREGGLSLLHKQIRHNASSRLETNGAVRARW